MIEIIENEFLRIEVSHLGAELQSVFNKRNQKEYLWQGNPSFWPRRSPVLFPVVGKLRDNHFKINNKIYSLGQHGFARDKQFKLNYKNQKKIFFELESTADTLSVFPYKFTLEISYELTDKRLSVNYNIKNTDNKTIYFSIGAHPGFNCPLYENEMFSDYYIEFEKKETLSSYLTKEGLFTGDTYSILEESNKIHLSEELFEKDALVFKKIKSSFLLLKSNKSEYLLKFNFGKFPFLGIWKKPEGDFVCIEPWHGLGDKVDFEGELRDKEGIEKLESNEIFEASFSVEIF